MIRDRPTLTIAGIASATSLALTVGAAARSQSLDGGAALVGLLVILALLLAPYSIAVLASGGSPARRRWLRTGVLLYGAADVLLRAQVVFFPGSSTDAIALLTIPIVVAPLAFAGAALVVAVSSLVSRARS
jgi:hypothetical protein